MVARSLSLLLVSLMVGCDPPAPVHRVGGPGPEPFSPPLVLTPGDAGTVVETVAIDGGVKVQWGNSSAYVKPTLGRDLYGTTADAGVASAQHGAILFSDAGVITLKKGGAVYGWITTYAEGSSASVQLTGGSSTPTNANPAIVSDGVTYTEVNAPTSTSPIYFQAAGPGLNLGVWNNQGLFIGVATSMDSTAGAGGVLGLANASTPISGPCANGACLESLSGGLYARSGTTVSGSGGDLYALAPATAGTYHSHALVFGDGAKEICTTTQAGTCVLSVTVPSGAVCSWDWRALSYVTATTGGTVTGLTVGDSWVQTSLGNAVKAITTTAAALTTSAPITAVTSYDTSQVGNSCAVTYSGLTAVVTCTALSTNGVLKWTVESTREDCN